MKKTLIIGLLFFAGGFLTHALFFPDVFANGFQDISNIVIPNDITPSGSVAANNDPLITKIEFDGEHFSKHSVTIGFTRYIQIVNTSPTVRMNLGSNLKALATSRGYAESEAVQTQFTTKGTFVVEDRNNRSEKLVITVK